MDCEGEYDYEETVESLKRVFGIVGICPVVRLQDNGFEQLKKMWKNISEKCTLRKTRHLRLKQEEAESLIR